MGKHNCDDDEDGEQTTGEKMDDDEKIQPVLFSVTNYLIDAHTLPLQIVATVEAAILISIREFQVAK